MHNSPNMGITSPERDLSSVYVFMFQSEVNVMCQLVTLLDRTEILHNSERMFSHQACCRGIPNVFLPG